MRARLDDTLDAQMFSETHNRFPGVTYRQLARDIPEMHAFNAIWVICRACGFTDDWLDGVVARGIERVDRKGVPDAWSRWADDWLSGKDRSIGAAVVAHRHADWGSNAESVAGAAVSAGWARGMGQGGEALAAGAAASAHRAVFFACWFEKKDVFRQHLVSLIEALDKES